MAAMILGQLVASFGLNDARSLCPCLPIEVASGHVHDILIESFALATDSRATFVHDCIFYLAFQLLNIFFHTRCMRQAWISPEVVELSHRVNI